LSGASPAGFVAVIVQGLYGESESGTVCAITCDRNR
jgi:hypothetical protein